MVLFSLDGDVLEAGVVHCKAWVGERRRGRAIYLGGGGETYNFCSLQNGNTKRGLFETRRRPNTYKDPPALGPILANGCCFFWRRGAA